MRSMGIEIVREGLYESVITAAVEAEIRAATDLEPQTAGVDEANEVHVLTQLIADAVGRRLGQERNRDGRLRITNGVLQLLGSDEGSVEAPTRELMGMSRPAGPGIPARYRGRPMTPLKERR